MRAGTAEMGIKVFIINPNSGEPGCKTGSFGYQNPTGMLNTCDARERFCLLNKLE